RAPSPAWSAMIVRLTERDAGPLPRVRNRNPPDGPRYAQPAGRRSDGRSPAAGKTKSCGFREAILRTRGNVAAVQVSTIVGTWSRRANNFSGGRADTDNRGSITPARGAVRTALNG